MWVLPSEYDQLFPPLKAAVNGNADTDTDEVYSPEPDHRGENVEEYVGSGDDLIEVSARDFARRSLEIIGLELGLGLGLGP